MPAVARHQLKGDDKAFGVHVRIADDDPEVVQVRFFEAPGTVASEATSSDSSACTPARSSGDDQRAIGR